MQTNFSELNKLRNGAKCLENTCEGIEEKIAAIVDPSVVILTRKLRLEREEYTKKLKKLISVISYAIKDITEELDNNNYISNAGSLKTSMIALQHEISTGKFELQSQLSCLQEEESVLIEELKMYEIYLKEGYTLDEINEKNANQAFKKVIVNEEEGIGSLWNRENQLKYLKAKKTHNDFDQMCKVLTALIPGITEEDIFEYENSQKEQENTIEMRSKKNVNPGGSTSSRKSNKKNAAYEEKMKEKLAAWRAEKKDKEIMQQHLDQLMVIKKTNEELYRRLKNEQTKEKVMQWKKEKAELALALERKRQEEEKTTSVQRNVRANSIIQQYRKQDLELIKKRAERKFKENNPQSFQTVKFYAKRDPNRLHTPTEQWSARTKRNGASDSKHTICNIKFINKLAVPTWRRSN